MNMRGRYSVNAAMTSSTTLSASARISSSVRSWMGWRTKQRFASMPRALACAAAACLNPLEAIDTEGTP